MAKRSNKFLFSYHILVILLALFSIGLVLMSLTGRISMIQYPYNYINNGILLFFAVDYAIRLLHAEDKKRFLIENSFDLLGLIPMHPLFMLFRAARIARILRYHKIFSVLGIDGKMTNSIHRFIYGTGFIYLFSISVVILVLSALLFSIVEKISLSNALWWAITTATTVGYGDISPHTAIGKIIASFLMIGGIGFIGLLTSTITDFFTANSSKAQNNIEVEETDLKKLTDQIERLTRKVDRLSRQMSRLTDQSENKKRK